MTYDGRNYRCRSGTTWRMQRPRTVHQMKWITSVPLECKFHSNPHTIVYKKLHLNYKSAPRPVPQHPEIAGRRRHLRDANRGRAGQCTVATSLPLEVCTQRNFVADSPLLTANGPTDKKVLIFLYFCIRAASLLHTKSPASARNHLAIPLSTAMENVHRVHCGRVTRVCKGQSQPCTQAGRTGQPVSPYHQWVCPFHRQ